MNYEQLVKALRERARREDEYYEHGGDVINDAAAAIEALQADMKTYGDTAFKEGYEMGFAAGEARAEKRMEPKRGKWITHPEVKNIYGGVYIECPFCGEKYVVQNVSDEKFCRNCGADLRAKMEVQDGQ